MSYPFPRGMGWYAQRPSILVRLNARAQSDSPTVMRWVNQDPMLLASHSSDCLSSCYSRCFDQVPAFGVLKQPNGDFLGLDELLMLAIRLLDNAGDDWKDVSLFPRRFQGW